jgi:hypothetical protein
VRFAIPGGRRLLTSRPMKTVLLTCAALALATPAFAGPCAEKITHLQSRYDSAPIAQGEAPVAEATGATSAAGESIGAKLHHQPAPASAADANDPAMSERSTRDARFKVAMEEATAAEDSGDEPTCESAAARAAQALAH